MSIETLTTQDFVGLEPKDHQEAITQYNDGIVTLATELGNQEAGTPAHNALLDRMGRLFTLRKVHKVRLEEMMADDEFEATEMNGPTLATAA